MSREKSHENIYCHLDILHVALLDIYGALSQLVWVPISLTLYANKFL